MPLLRRAPWLVLLLALLPAPLKWAAAQGLESAYMVRNVQVDVRAADAAEAREKAFSSGQYRAFQRLMARLVPESARVLVPDLTIAEIVPMVRDVAVSDEKASSVRYIASLTVRFKPNAVREFLRGSGIPYAEARQKPLLLLPVFIAEQGAVLWDDPNPWRQVWSERKNGGLVPIHLPLGEIGDVAAITAQEALLMDSRALETIAGRYGTEDALVAMARLDVFGDGSTELVVDLSGFGPSVPRTVRRMTFQGHPGEPMRDLMARAAEAVAVAVDEGYKAGNVIAADRGGSVTVTAPLRDFDDWLLIRRRLGEVTLLNGYRVGSLSTTRAEMVLDYVGETEHLIEALARNGLTLTLGGDGRWTLLPVREQSG